MNKEMNNLKKQIDELNLQHNKLKELYFYQMEIIKSQRDPLWDKCDTCELHYPRGYGELLETEDDEDKWICTYCHMSLLDISEGTPPTN